MKLMPEKNHEFARIMNCEIMKFEDPLYYNNNIIPRNLDQVILEITISHGKVEIFLEQREVAFLSPSKICKKLNFSTVHLYKFKFSQILLGDKNATSLCSENISTLTIWPRYFS